MNVYVWIFIGIQIFSIMTATLMALEYLRLYRARQAIFEGLGDGRRVSPRKKYTTLALYIITTMMIPGIYGYVFFF